ncbi:MAG: hypothetical protein INF52_16725 [Rhodobacter sp.]|nr:hypothetical protein [Rhodobacter sp.]
MARGVCRKVGQACGFPGHGDPAVPAGQGPGQVAIPDHNATAIIAIRKNGQRWREDCPAAAARNAILRDIRQEGREAMGGTYENLEAKRSPMIQANSGLGLPAGFKRLPG